MVDGLGARNGLNSSSAVVFPQLKRRVDLTERPARVENRGGGQVPFPYGGNPEHDDAEKKPSTTDFDRAKCRLDSHLGTIIDILA